jgi:hypothetical protein
MIAMSKPWDVRVDFNTYPGPDFVYGNARHADPGVVVRRGAVLTLGDEDWGVVRAEVVEFDEATGTFTARLVGDIVALDEGAANPTA